MVKYSNCFDIVATIENQIPLDLNFELIPLNAANQLISGITVSSADTIRSCNIDKSVRKSILNVEIKETEEGSIKLLDGIGFKVWATKNSTVAGMPVKSNQYFTIYLKIPYPMVST